MVNISLKTFSLTDTTDPVECFTELYYNNCSSNNCSVTQIQTIVKTVDVTRPEICDYSITTALLVIQSFVILILVVVFYYCIRKHKSSYIVNRQSAEV